MVQGKGDKPIRALSSSVIVCQDLQPRGALAPFCRVLPASQSGVTQNAHRARAWHPLLAVVDSVCPGL